MPDDVAADLALGAFRLVKENLDFELDFTPETLPVLDHYLAQLREEDGGVPEDKVVAVVAPCVGAYFGEVIRRAEAGLRWHLVEDDYKRWRIEAEPVFFAFNPIGAALEAIYDESVPDWNAHLSLLPEEQPVVEGALENAGPVRASDYHRLSMRHEVISHTLAVLADLRAAQPTTSTRTFAADVYAAVLDDKKADAKS